MLTPMPPKIVLLHDAHATARADTSDVLVEAQYIAASLQTLGFEAIVLPVSLDLAALRQSLRELAPQAVFNLMEAIEGHSALIHAVPALLETLHVPFTGCSARAQWCTSYKPWAKRQLELAGVQTPALWSPHADAAGPWIVKSAWEHASLGLDDASVLTDAAKLPDALAQRRKRYGGEWFAERFIAGREFNAAIIASDKGPRVLPIAEIRFQGYPQDKPQIVGYAAKWQPESFEYGHTERCFSIERPMQDELAATARRCWEVFALDGYARVDFRVDAQGMPWVLEVNANPCLSADAGFAAMLAEANIDFPTAVGWLIEDAQRRAHAEAV